MSFGCNFGALPPRPSATRMSPLGRMSVWRGIARSVAIAVMAYPGGTVGRWSPHSAGLAIPIVGTNWYCSSGSGGFAPYCVGSGSLPPHAASAKESAASMHTREALHGAALLRTVEKPTTVAAHASTATITRKYEPVGMVAHASRAWMNALTTPRTHIARMRTRETAKRPRRRSARRRSTSEHTSAATAEDETPDDQPRREIAPLHVVSRGVGVVTQHGAEKQRDGRGEEERMHGVYRTSTIGSG